MKVSFEKLGVTVAKIREQNQTIVTLNGSFDLLHAGHLHIISEAKRQADCLIVALNTDASIKAYKDPYRPLVTLEHRLDMIDALKAVSYVTWFSEPDPRAFLEIVKPDVHVNGSEYGANCIEADVVKKYGGRIHVVALIPGISTTQVIKKIKALK